MSQLLMHPKTQDLVNRVIQHPPHALLIAGAEGSGKSAMSDKIANNVLNTDNLAGHAYVKMLDASAGEGIAQVREIRKFLSLKTTGQSVIRRIVIIENADSLGADAQNALLKILEEPPIDTMIILTAGHAHQLLSTIRSRVHALKILPLGKNYCLSLETHTTEELTRAYALSNGRAGEFVALLGEGAEHPIVESVAMAKSFLGQKPYERLSQVDILAKDKEQTKKLLVGLEKCLHATMTTANHNNLATLHCKLECVSVGKKSFENNTNTKLLLTSLAINL